MGHSEKSLWSSEDLCEYLKFLGVMQIASHGRVIRMAVKNSIGNRTTTPPAESSLSPSVSNAMTSHTKARTLQEAAGKLCCPS